VDWAGFDKDYPRRKVTLPTYPFQRQRYWVDVKTDPSAPNDAEELAQCLYEVAWRPIEPTPTEGAAPAGICLVLADAGGIGADFVGALERRGQICRLCPAASVDWKTPAAVTDLLLHANGVAGHLAQVVYLGSLDEGSDAADSATAERLTTAVLHLAQALARRPLPARLWVVTRGGQAVLPGDMVSPAQTALWGLGKVIGLEHPQIWGGLVDVPVAAAPVAAVLERVLGATDSEDQVAVRDGLRHVARLRRAPLDAPLKPQRLTAAGTYLITGGLGALGLLTAGRLVERGARHLVLLGRTGLPARDERLESTLDEVTRARIQAVEKLETHGAVVHVVAVDVADRAALAEALQSLERLPPLRGVYHAAGTLDDGVLLNQSPERSAKVFAAKVRGAQHLDELTRRMPLEHFVLFSSTASVLGSAGQAAYAAANAFLDGLAHRRRAQGLPGLSINWGPWAEVGMAAQADRGNGQRWTKTGAEPLPVRLALMALEELTESGRVQGTVLRADWRKAGRGQQRSWPLLSELVEADAKMRAGLPERLEEAPIGQRAEVLAAHVCATVAGVMGLQAGSLPKQVGFFELGMDSLMALDLRNRLQADLGGPVLSSTLIFDHPTLEALTGHLAGKLQCLSEAVTPTDPSLADRSAPFEQLSDNDILSLLDRKVARFLGKESNS